MYLIGYAQDQKTDWRLCDGIKVIKSFSSPALQPDSLRQGEIVNLLRPYLLKGKHQAPEQVYLYGKDLDDSRLAAKVSGAFIQLQPRIQVELFSPMEGVFKMLNQGESRLIWMGRPWIAGRMLAEKEGELTIIGQPASLPWDEPASRTDRKKALEFVDKAMEAAINLGPMPDKGHIDLIGELSPWQFRLLREVLHDNDLFVGLVIRKFFPALLAFHRNAAAGMGL